MPDLTPSRVNQNLMVFGAFENLPRQCSWAARAETPRGGLEASSSLKPCYGFVWRPQALVLLLTCGGHSRTELNSDKNTQPYTSPPIYLQKGHRWLVPTWESLRPSLHHTGRSSFNREENEQGLGLVKVFAHSLKRGGCRDHLGCLLILTSWRPERLNDFARWSSSQWHTWNRNQPFCFPGIRIIACCPHVRACGCVCMCIGVCVSVHVRDCERMHVCMRIPGTGGGRESEQRTSGIIINRKPRALCPLFLARGSLCSLQVGLRQVRQHWTGWQGRPPCPSARSVGGALH